MEKLFSYGTLQYKSVQLETFGRELVGAQDTLIGYSLSSVYIKDPKVIEISGEAVHKMLKHTGNVQDVVKGMVFDVTLQEIKQADKYEDTAYKRVAVKLGSGLNAWVYADASQI